MPGSVFDVILSFLLNLDALWICKWQLNPGWGFQIICEGSIKIEPMRHIDGKWLLNETNIVIAHHRILKLILGYSKRVLINWSLFISEKIRNEEICNLHSFFVFCTFWEIFKFKDQVVMLLLNEWLVILKLELLIHSTV